MKPPEFDLPHDGRPSVVDLTRAGSPSAPSSTRGSRRNLCWIGLVALLSWLGCSNEPSDVTLFEVDSSRQETAREECAHRDPRRMALFGDLHVHTALSSDAANYDLSIRPSGAYAYAFGESVLLPPMDASGSGTRAVRIDRPLDFAAVTDHAEFLGEQVLCADPESEAYATETCREIRDASGPIDSPLALMIMHPFPSREDEICGADGKACDDALGRGWTEVIDAAEKWNDTSSACQRTAFIAYEYSSFRLGSNLHRNVIFRGSVVPKRPLSYVDVTREWKLWELLNSTCNESDTGCQVLAIPHNSNISNGRMFAVDYPDAGSPEEEAARAALRIAVEPVVEIMQHKGDSECHRNVPGVMGSDDPLCDFEKFEDKAITAHGTEEPEECYDGPFADSVPHLGPSCISRRSYVRYALVDGLAEEARIGVNPFKFGIMASTDTHNGTPGAVREPDWEGHLGIADDTKAKRLDSGEGSRMGDATSGPGGLIGVWAEENSRAAIFDAMRRKEVFGTSGPRIQPRFYGGWDLPEGLCESPDVLAAAEASGVPMGGDLTSTDASRGPAFAVWAARDPGTPEMPGGLLQRLQVIKGWVDDDGIAHEEVVDVAGGDSEASVDRTTCEPTGPGHDALCGVWRDPDFDPARRAVYYARVVENPSCRYSAWQCLGLPEEERPSECRDPVMQTVQQERAWTSPVWYTPSGGSEDDA